jgi:hypothetical protein
MSDQNKPTTNDKNYSHLTENDLTEGKEINELMSGLDEQTKKLVLVYARGLSDMQAAGEKRTA